MAGQAGQRKLSTVPAARVGEKPAVKPKNRGGRPRTRVSAVIGNDSVAGQRELLVVLRRKCATLLDATKSASAAERLMTRLTRYDEQIRAIDAEVAELAAAEAEAAADEAEDDAADDTFDPDTI